MKSKRQKRIMEIINQEPIGTQEELAQHLLNEGISVTQATVSRDIKELRLVKVARGDGYAYGLPSGQPSIQDNTRLRRILRDAVLRIAESENIIVIHTLPGNANSVCSLLDGAEWEEYLGAVAGDDTILVVAKSKDHVAVMMDRLREMIEQ
ncbi:MAG: arginine repressor [Clostridiales bacterium]|nr:arginine repressor [Clostridiales bacterium]